LRRGTDQVPLVASDVGEHSDPAIRLRTGRAQELDWLEERFGPVPMTLLAWVRLVGDVWLVGTHPKSATAASADPLVIELEGSRYANASIRNYFIQAVSEALAFGVLSMNTLAMNRTTKVMPLTGARPAGPGGQSCVARGPQVCLGCVDHRLSLHVLRE
jgi:hypothetical protein